MALSYTIIGRIPCNRLGNRNMAIGVTCDECDTELRVDGDLAGKRIKCPECHVAITVPANTVEGKKATKKKTRGKTRTGGGRKWLLIGGGLAVVLAALAGGYFLLTSRPGGVPFTESLLADN